MKASTKLFLFTIALGLAFAYCVNIVFITHAIGLAALLLVTLCAWNYPNIRFVSLGYLVISVVEVISVNIITKKLIPDAIPFIANSIVFLWLLCVDLSIYWFVKNRQSIQLRFKELQSTKAQDSILLPSIVDAPLMGIALLFCSINMLNIFENIIRNLEHLGIPEDFAKQFWEWNWIYYATHPIKFVLQTLAIVILFAGIYITRSRAARGEKPLSYDDCSTSN